MSFRFAALSRSVVLIGFVAAGLSLKAQSLNPAPSPDQVVSSAAQPLSIDEAIARALKSNFNLEITNYATENAKQAVEIAKAPFDPVGYFTSVRTYTKTAQPYVNQRNGNAVSPISDVESSRLGVSELLPTGATYGLYTNLNRTHNNSASSSINPSNSRIIDPAYASAYTLTASQPILQGALPFIAQAPIRLAKLNLVIANLNYKTQLLTTIQSVENAYYNLVYAREQLKVRQLSIDTAQKAYDQSKAKRTTGVATDLDVVTAEVGLATARSNLAVAQQAVKDSQDALLSLIGRFELDSAVQVAPFAAYTEAVPSFELSYKKALDNDPDFASAQAVIQQSEISLRVAKNSTLPQLSVGGTLGLGGLQGNPYDAYDQLPKDQGYVWGVNVQLSIPIGNRGPRAQLRQALSNLSLYKAKLLQLEQNVMVQVRSAVRTVQTNNATVAYNNDAVRLAEKQYQLQTAKLNAGLGTALELQQARDALDNARISELQAQVNLRNALSALHKLEGSSLDQYHIAYTEVRPR